MQKSIVFTMTVSIMDEYIKSIKAHLYDRATSPLFGTFAASWLAWNYKFVVVLASAMDVEKKLMFISTTLYGSAWDRYGIGLFFPLLTAVAFLYCYPFLAKPIYRFVRQKQIELQDVKRQIEGETTLTVKDSRILRRALLTQEREFETTLHERDSTIQELKEIITDLEEKLKLVDTGATKQGDITVTPTKVALSEPQLAMLKLVASNPRIDELTLLSRAHHEFPEEDYVTEYNLGELRRLTLVETQGYDAENNVPLYSATHFGREYLIKQSRVNDSAAA